MIYQIVKAELASAHQPWLQAYGDIEGKSLEQVKEHWNSRLQDAEQKMAMIYLNVRKLELELEQADKDTDILSLRDKIVSMDLSSSTL